MKLDWLDIHIIGTTASAGVPFHDSRWADTIKMSLSLREFAHQCHLTAMYYTGLHSDRAKAFRQTVSRFS